MSDSSNSSDTLKRKISTASDLYSVGRSMKAMVAANVGQYENAVTMAAANVGQYENAVLALNNE